MKTEARSTNRSLIIWRIVAVLVICVLWQLIVMTGALPSMVPGIIDIFAAMATSLALPTFWMALGQSTVAAFTGWILASVVGIVLGLVIGSLPIVDRWTSTLIDFGRAFPVLALMPVVILLLGANTTMEIVVVGLSCLWPVLVQTIYGTRRQDPAVVDTVKIFRIPSLLVFRRVLLPGAMPFIATGLRIASAISILVAIGVEVITQTPGLGRQITLAQENQRWDLAFAYIIFAGIFGWAIATGLQVLEARVLRWNRQLEN